MASVGGRGKPLRWDRSAQLSAPPKHPKLSVVRRPRLYDSGRLRAATVLAEGKRFVAGKGQAVLRRARRSAEPVKFFQFGEDPRLEAELRDSEERARWERNDFRSGVSRIARKRKQAHLGKGLGPKGWGGGSEDMKSLSGHEGFASDCRSVVVTCRDET